MFKLISKAYHKLSPKMKKVVCCLIIGCCCLYVGVVGLFVYHFIDTLIESNEMRTQIMEDINAMQNPTTNILFTDEEKEEREFAQESTNYNFRVEFLDVGAADCTLITDGTHHMLIDTGDAEDAEKIIRHLHSKDIVKLDYVVCTNENDEHIGGLKTIMDSIEIEHLIIPNQYTSNEYLLTCATTATFNGTEVTEAAVMDAWNIGEAQCVVLQNTYNVILKFTVKNVSFLFMSDAGKSEELELLESDLDISSDFIKASAHGAVDTSADDLLREVDAEYSIVSCDEEVEKPDIHTLNRLYKRTITCRTDRHDTLVVTTDGVRYRIRSEKINCNG